MKVLLVDDDPEFREFTAFALEEAGIASVSAKSGDEAARLLRETQETFDVILLDVEMPGTSGHDLLTELRDAGDEVPVIFVSGRIALEDRVGGLRLGADDYLCKPVEFEELIARLEAVYRRRQSLAPLMAGDIVIDRARRKIERAGAAVHLSPKEYDLLTALISAGGEVVSREKLLLDVWDINFDPETNIVNVHIGRLRKKLDRNSRPCIETVRGEGYRFVSREPALGD